MAKKKQNSNAGSPIEPEIKVNFRRPWVLIITLVIAALILAAAYYVLV